MANDFYNPSGSPTTGAAGSSAVQRTEFASIAAGFAKFPGLTGNGSRAVIVNAGGTGLTVTTGTLTLAGNLATTGAFNTTLAQTASVTLTLPGVSGTLATLAGTEAFTNKTYSGLTISTTTGTLAIAAGVTFTVSNSLTLAGTGGTTMTFPGTNATLARTDAGQSFSGTQAFGALTATTVNGMTLTGSGSVDFGTGGTVLYSTATTTLTGDVTGSGTSSIVTTVAKIAGTVVSGTTGSGSVVFATSPTVTGISSNTFTSTVATGTAPFTVSSTTVVTNLNAAQLNGATFASPGTIGGTTPGAATVTTLNTTTIASGAWNGTKIGLLYGGTNADLTATGGANQFLKQTSVGAAVTVAAIVAADLPVMVGDSGSGGTKGAVPAPSAGDAAALKFLKADGTWVAVSSGVTSIADATNGGLNFSASTGAVTANLKPSDLLTKASPTASDSVVIMDAAAANAAKTSLISAITALASGAIVTPQGRLTLVTATPVMTTTQSAKTSVFYTPYIGSYYPVYSGSAWSNRSIAELSVALDATNFLSGVMYDLFLYNDSGTDRLGYGPSWATGGGSTTARGTGAGSTELQLLNGIQTNKNSITLRYSSVATTVVAANQATYVGTALASGNGQTQFVFGALAANGTAAAFNLWNCYNRVLVQTFVQDTTDSWSYATQAWRSANNSATMRVSFIQGLAEDGFEAKYLANSSSALSGASAPRFSGIGYDVTNALASGCASGRADLAIVDSGAVGTAPVCPMLALYSKAADLGSHFCQAIEYGNASGAAVFCGDNGTPATTQSGLYFSGRF